jgi:hypothetical protein
VPISGDYDYADKSLDLVEHIGRRLADSANAFRRDIAPSRSV